MEKKILLEELVVEKLRKKKLSISTGESCTGGMIASRLINVSGVSEVFYEGIVTYSDTSKIKRLGVKEESLKQYGAVSFEVAKEMLEGLLTDVGVVTTGIAGPQGGTEEKPVGLVYIGIKVEKNILVEKKFFLGDRLGIREKATTYALEKLLEKL